MADNSFVVTLYTEIVTAFSNKTATMATGFANAVKPVYVAAVGLYVVYLVYRFNSEKDVILHNIMNQLALFVVVGAFSFGGSWYNSSVIPFVQNSGDELAQAIGGNSTKSSTNAIDTINTQFLKVREPFEDQWDDAGITETGKLLEAGMAIVTITAAQVIFSIAIAVNLALAKIMVNLLLTVGVLFIGFALFPSTRSMFTSFTGLCLNYILLNALYSAAVVLTESFLSTRLAQPTGSAYVQILVGTLIIVFALNQIPTLVSSLTGGVGISPFTAGGMFGAAAGLTKGGLGLFKRDGGFRNFLQGKRSSEQRNSATKGAIGKTADTGRWIKRKFTKEGSASN